MYQLFNVYRDEPSELVGQVSANDAAEAVFRLLGGEYGRADYWAAPLDSCPLAAPGLVSYRYPSPYGFVMIGARDKADAMREAARSITGRDPDPANLEIWCATARRYVKA